MGKSFHNSARTREHWRTNRLFDPSKIYKPEDIKAGYFICDICPNFTYVCCECEESQCPNPNCGRLAFHPDSIVIAVDGACPFNGTPQARAAIGVFSQQDSIYNWCHVLPSHMNTNQVAELMAGIRGLETALSIAKTGVPSMDREGNQALKQVIIKSDSAYLVNAMTDWIFKWWLTENGYFLNAKGRTVKNSVFIRKLQNCVTELNELDVEVLFWHVPREQNREADALANKALETS